MDFLSAAVVAVGAEPATLGVMIGDGRFSFQIALWR